MKPAATSLRRVLLSPLFADLFSDNGSVDMMDEDAISNLSIHLKLSLTVWDFVLPATPSLPAVIGVSCSYFYLKLILIFYPENQQKGFDGDSRLFSISHDFHTIVLGLQIQAFLLIFCTEALNCYASDKSAYIFFIFFRKTICI